MVTGQPSSRVREAFYMRVDREFARMWSVFGSKPLDPGV